MQCMADQYILPAQMKWTSFDSPSVLRNFIWGAGVKEETGGMHDFQAAWLLAVLQSSPTCGRGGWWAFITSSHQCHLGQGGGTSGNRVWSQLPPSFLPSPPQGPRTWCKSTDVNRSLIKGAWIRPQGHCLQELFMANRYDFKGSVLTSKLNII